MLAPGTTLQDKYVIERVLGEGGMGAVYCAVQTTLGGKRVAIKELILKTTDPAERQQAAQQFAAEAHMLARLSHPNLVEVFDHFEESGHHYLVMALVDGQTLDAVQVAAGGPLPAAQVLGWAEELCDVLDYLHSQAPPVLFRDLKPGNVMLDRRGHIRLIDFGIARCLDAGLKTSTYIKGAGTPGFSPVEQFGSGGTDARSDIYALGCTLYVLLTGVVPPDSITLISGEATLEPLQQLNPAVPPSLAQAVAKMMALRKENRYASIGEVREALRSPVCPACGARSEHGLAFCEHCGAAVQKAAVAAAPAAGLATSRPAAPVWGAPPAPPPAMAAPAPPAWGPPPAPGQPWGAAPGSAHPQTAFAPTVTQREAPERPAWRGPLLGVGAVLGIVLVAAGLRHPQGPQPEPPSPSVAVTAAVPDATPSDWRTLPPRPTETPTAAFTAPSSPPTSPHVTVVRKSPEQQKRDALAAIKQAYRRSADAVARKDMNALIQPYASSLRGTTLDHKTMTYGELVLLWSFIFRHQIRGQAKVDVLNFKYFGNKAIVRERTTLSMKLRADNGTLGEGGFISENDDTWMRFSHGWRQTAFRELSRRRLY